MHFRQEQASKAHAASREAQQRNDELMRQILGDSGEGDDRKK